MPPDRFRPDDPAEWLNRARSSLAQAKVRHPEVYLEDLCFHAQQAVEKAIKALLLKGGVRFPHIHDIAELLHLLMDAGKGIPPRIAEASRLTEYAVAARYPGVSEPVTEEDYLEALALAEDVVRWAWEGIQI